MVVEPPVANDHDVVVVAGEDAGVVLVGVVKRRDEEGVVGMAAHELLIGEHVGQPHAVAGVAPLGFELANGAGHHKEGPLKLAQGRQHRVVEHGAFQPAEVVDWAVRRERARAVRDAV